MRNSNLGLLGNLSIGIPTESRIRELSEYDDKSVIINDGES